MEGAKACTKCGEVKPLSEFISSSRNKSGYAELCSACNKEKSKTYRRTLVGKDLIQWKLRQLVYDSRFRAKKAGIDHDLDLNYLLEILPDCCPYLGTQFHWEANVDCGHQKCHSCSPSVDRIDGSKGYVKGNVVIVSHRANAIKNNATEQELFRIGRALSLLKAEMAFPD